MHLDGASHPRLVEQRVPGVLLNKGEGPVAHAVPEHLLVSVGLHEPGPEPELLDGQLKTVPALSAFLLSRRIELLRGVLGQDQTKMHRRVLQQRRVVAHNSPGSVSVRDERQLVFAGR